ncbi:hypothetical protein HRbin30_02222 [bacterium HR30]|nr:hypothetical protein HRbin30_02222 [bacterium HR30]
MFRTGVSPRSPANPERPGGGEDPVLEQCPLGELRTDVMVPAVREVVRAPRKEAWERQFRTPDALRAALRQRLEGWPERPPSAMPDLPEEPEAFLRQVARDTWKGLRSLRDREHGLPIDHVRWLGVTLSPTEAKIGDYTSSSNLGLFLLAVVAARDLGLETHDSALALVRAALDTLGRLEQYRGFFFNYYDTTSLERTSHFLSFVDSSWLTVGLVVVRNALPETTSVVSRFLRRENYGFFYDAARGQMRHGYYVEPGVFSPFHYGMLFTEARLGSLLAIGKGDVPRAHWYAMVRTYPPGCQWQRQRPQAASAERRNGFTVYRGYYQWGGVSYIPSWGGSMFEALMPLLVLDETRHAPYGWGANAVAHAVVQRRYAREVLSQEVWGESPSMDPHEVEYREFGVPPLGTRGYPSGAVTPHASALALSVTPMEAITNLQRLARQYPVYGDFGFFDAVDPRSGVVARGYLNIDQSMILVAIANYLLSGGVRKYFESDPWVQAALPLVAEENLFASLDPKTASQ